MTIRLLDSAISWIELLFVIEVDTNDDENRTNDDENKADDDENKTDDNENKADEEQTRNNNWI